MLQSVRFCSGLPMNNLGLSRVNTEVHASGGPWEPTDLKHNRFTSAMYGDTIPAPVSLMKDKSLITVKPEWIYI